MKILKPGKAKILKLRCCNCGCEFVYEYFGNIYFTETAHVKCPQDGCNGKVFLKSGERYDEPMQNEQSNKLRLYELMKKVWPHSLGELEVLSTFLADHGVTIEDGCNG